MSRGGRALRAAVVFFVTAVAGAVGYVEWMGHKSWDAPYPPITADLRPESYERGAWLFEAKCAGCHRPPGSIRPIGRHMDDLPPELGRFVSANLTRDPVAGIGAFTDAEIARAVRFGVTRDGRRSLMGWALSDDDLAAVIGYLRSDAPAFEADPTVQPRARRCRAT